MKVRLVAYRNATADTTNITAYDLDLQEQPNIALNFQFSDIKEPEKRKGSYSQTFKLPFTQANDNFFQTWYNINLDAPVFNTRTRFAATLFYGTVPQFDGFIQLKAVYLKAKLYEITLQSNASNLFTNIGNKKLQEVLFEDDGLPSRRWNHLYNVLNLRRSWDGTSDFFDNVDGSLNFRDTVSNVQIITYPMSFTDINARFRANSSEYMDMDQDDINNTDLYPTIEDAQAVAVNVTQFRPALQLRALLKLIIAQAGFSYTSTFIDSAYFGKLFMTTGGHLTTGRPAVVGSGGEVTNSMIVGSSNSIQISYPSSAPTLDTCSSINDFAGYNWRVLKADVTSPTSSAYDVPDDPLGLWTAGEGNYITKTDTNMTNLQVDFVMNASGIMTCGWAQWADTNNWPIDMNVVTVEVCAWKYEPSTDTIEWQLPPIYTDSQEVQVNAQGDINNLQMNFYMNIWDLNIGASCKVLVRIIGWERKVTGGSPETVDINFGVLYNNINDNQFGGLRYIISLSWSGYGANVYGREIDVPACIGTEITQKAFLKDIIERFNLVIIPDPKDPNKLIIEPYNEFMAGGDIKDWTDKLDTSKEIIVKDTTSLQKRNTILTDLEDVDLMNRAVKEETQHLNVYGHVDITVQNNDFATGDFKNNPIFAPYINQKVFQSDNDQDITHIRNMAVQYEWTTQKVEGGYEKVLEQTKSKLFYYSGVPTDVNCQGEDRYFLHNIAYNTIFAYQFTQYPLCSPFELTPTGTPGESQITSTTRSLYWNQNGPPCGELEVFQYAFYTTLPMRNLYAQYWFQFFNTIYHPDSRIMECYLQLNPVDIITFRFNDQIFIKDTYWRILDIKNYQVGQTVSTKVTLVKQMDVFASVCANANYVVGEIGGNNTFFGVYLWCSINDTDCTPFIDTSSNPVDLTGIYTDEASCTCVGGSFIPLNQVTGFTPPFAGAGICKPNENSPSLRESNLINYRNIFSKTTGQKSLLNGRLGGVKSPFITGSNTTKNSKPIVPRQANDVVIKYNTRGSRAFSLHGESHRTIFMGKTVGTTRGYAYPEGEAKNGELRFPNNSNVFLVAKGTATVIGGTSTTYPIGTTEGFEYKTAFKVINGEMSQLGAAGGERVLSLKESGFATPQTTMYIYPQGTTVWFGLNDLQTDTVRVWEIAVDYQVNVIPSVDMGYDLDYALFQNGDIIQYENDTYMLWN